MMMRGLFADASGCGRGGGEAGELLADLPEAMLRGLVVGLTRRRTRAGLLLTKYSPLMPSTSGEEAR